MGVKCVVMACWVCAAGFGFVGGGCQGLHMTSDGEYTIVYFMSGFSCSLLVTFHSQCRVQLNGSSESRCGVNPWGLMDQLTSSAATGTSIHL